MFVPIQLLTGYQNAHFDVQWLVLVKTPGGGGAGGGDGDGGDGDGDDNRVCIFVCRKWPRSVDLLIRCV